MHNYHEPHWGVRMVVRSKWCRSLWTSQNQIYQVCGPLFVKQTDGDENGGSKSMSMLQNEHVRLNAALGQWLYITVQDLTISDLDLKCSSTCP